MSSFNILDDDVTIDENLFIEASAGCGKTFTLEHLALKLIQKGGKFEELVIVTFTKKGAEDLKSRIISRLEEAGVRVSAEEGNITTLHGFALKMLQEEPYALNKLYETLVAGEEEEKLATQFLDSLHRYFPVEEALEILKEKPQPKLEALLKHEKLKDPLSTHLKELAEKKGLYTYDDLIKDLHALTESESVLKRLRARFKVGIIDEFQDTDPKQWEIFKRLFLHENRRLYLVGDPKQSIYAFRKGDVYTYMEAKAALGEKAKRVLKTNYRSDPELIEGLNRLFETKETPSFMHLPRIDTYLDNPPVLAPADAKPMPKLGPWEKLQLISYENNLETLLSYLADIIQNLRKKDPKLTIAILIDYNDLADKVEVAFKAWRIPTVIIQERQEMPSDLKQALELVEAAAKTPTADKALKLALLTPFFNWKAQALDALQDLELKEKIVWEFKHLNAALHKSPVHFFKRLLETKVGEITVRERLLALPEGETWLEALLNENHDSDPVTPDEPPLKEGVQVITMHKAKGLEYDVVIPLGLGMRRKTAKYTEEELAEKMRILYVALTRAKRQLFIPWNRAKPGKGTLSWFEKFLEYKPEGISGFSVIEAEEKTPWTLEIAKVDGLIQPPNSTPQFSVKEVLSFSRLQAREKEDKVIERAPVELSEGELPAGAETGLIFHELMESIPFGLIKSAELPSDLVPFVVGFIKNSVWEGFKEKLSQLLYDTFNLDLGNEGFKLKAVDPEKSFREIEFFHALDADYMNGVIDWFFEHEGKYYLIDWKTNCLPSYDDDTVKKAMEEEGYNRQAAIYREAAEKYLSRFNGAKIAGVFYIFVRGGKVWKAS
ncbi:MAG: UvrD-helicase domain-containing protein [Chlamydiia bacterium]|nr:UvrD-helicase domain-containing protein [Chlamydiia bacterium]